jgi:hypothetical protein
MERDPSVQRTLSEDNVRPLGMTIIYFVIPSECFALG